MTWMVIPHVHAILIFFGFVIICIHVSHSDAYMVLSDANGAIPVLACEHSYQVYAVSCLASGSGKFMEPKWFAWSSDGQSMSVDDGQDGKYKKASDGGQHFYLLITGAEIRLDNDGDRYSCFRPDYPPDEDEMKMLKEHAAVLRVLPGNRCNEESSTMAISQTTSTMGTSPTIPKSSTEDVTNNYQRSTHRLKTSARMNKPSQAVTQQIDNTQEALSPQDSIIQENVPRTSKLKTNTPPVSTPTVSASQANTFKEDIPITEGTSKGYEHIVTTPKKSSSRQNTSPKYSAEPNFKQTHTPVTLDNQPNVNYEERKQIPISTTNGTDISAMVKVVYIVLAIVCVFFALNLAVLYKISRMWIERKREVGPSCPQNGRRDCFLPLQGSYEEEVSLSDVSSDRI